MQNIVLSEQILSVVWAVLFGSCAAAVYDGVRLVRLLLFSNGKGSVTAANIADILYGMAAGCAFSVFLFIANFGRFRWYLLFSASMGFVLYRLSVGRITYRITVSAADTSRRITGKVLKILCIPVSAIINMIRSAVGRILLRRMNKRKEKEILRRKNCFSSGRNKKEDTG